MADNLLDKASILLTPTAYNDGSMLSVKPENGDGDFTFSRGSAATRVNAQGLVENVQIISSELVSNGDFSQGGQDWTLGTGWSIGDGKVTFNDSSNGDIRTSNSVFTINKKYKIQLTVGGLTSGTAFFGIGDSSAANLVTYDNYDNGDYSFEVVAPNGLELRIYATTSSGSSFFITNISVKEITDDTDLPRIDYTDGCGSWLLEPQSTNLITYSEDFSSLNIRDNAVVTSNQIISPSGLLDADEITFDGTLYGRVEAFVSATNGATYSISVYLKNKDLSDVTQVWLGFAQTGQGQFITITNEWQRYEITLAANGTTEYPRIQFSGTGSLYAWGFQTEQQSYATSYIPTNGAIATRLADVATNSGNSTLINSTEGVLYAEIAALADDGSTRVIQLSDGTNSNRIFIGYWTGSNNIRFALTSGGVIQTFQGSTSYDILNLNKIAFKFKENDFALWINGVEAVTDTSGITFPIGTLSQLDFDSNLSAYFYGKVKAVAVYKEALTDAQLQSLTTI